MTVSLPRDRVFRAIAGVARAGRVKVFLVGGPLRDLLLGRGTNDVDLAVEGSSRRFGTRLARVLGGRFTFHREFGTGTVQLPNGRHVDIARTRTETYPRPAELPSVTCARINGDLRRRDFTINTLACGLATRQLIDPCCGAEDLRNGVIRVLHERSFIDDPTRIFRAARFSVRLGFTVEPVTLRLLRDAIAQRLPRLLSGKRLRNELRLILAEPYAAGILHQLEEWGIWQSAFGVGLRAEVPRLLERLPVGARTEPGQAWTQSADLDGRLLLLLAMLPDTLNLPLTREERAALATIRGYRSLRPALIAARKPSRIAALLRSESRPALATISSLESLRVAAKLRRFLDTGSGIQPLLRGDDLKALGVRPGPIYTTLLQRLRNERLDRGELSREQELALVRRWTKNAVRSTPHAVRPNRRQRSACSIQREASLSL